MLSVEEMQQEYARYVAAIDPTMDKLAEALEGVSPLIGYTALVNLAALVLFKAEGEQRLMMAKVMQDVLEKAEEASKKRVEQ